MTDEKRAAILRLIRRYRDGADDLTAEEVLAAIEPAIRADERGLVGAEVERLRGALSAFLSYADQCPQRAAPGAGGQTIANMIRGTIVSVSLWEIEGLRDALAEDKP